MAMGADQYLMPSHPVTLTVFTDQVKLVQKFSHRLNRIDVQAIEVDPLGWPAATLSKFQMVVDHEDSLRQDFLIHLDADMRVVSNLGAPPNVLCPKDGIAVVKHPGFRRPSGFKRTGLYWSHPGLVLRDSYRILLEGGIGTWETNAKSTAYVSRGLRDVYVCGATWLGNRESLVSACRELAERVNADSRRGIVARFHDESHLNWYAAKRQCQYLDSSYCFVEGSPNLKDLAPVIIAVEKNADGTR